MDDSISSLEREYCPPIDSALFSAIISDYDLSLEASVSAVRRTLDALKASAEAEEKTAFDSSGSGGFCAQLWNGEDTDLTSLSYSAESLSIEEEGSPHRNGRKLAEHDAEFEALPTPGKEGLLTEMFPGLKAFDISYTLKKNHANFARTVEELLNQVFLLEEPSSDGEPQTVPRGIEGFTQPAHKPKTKRRKKGPQGRRSSSTPASSSDNPPTAIPSKWDQAKADVDFLTERTYIPVKSLASTYHKHNASLPATILALCFSEIQNPYLDPSDPILETHAIDLAHAFPTISPKHLQPLIQLTHPSTASAHDLASILAANPTTSLPPQSLIPQYARPDHSTSSLTTTRPTATTTISSPTTPSLSSPHAPHPSHLASHYLARAAAHHASRSPAATYYASLARTHLTTAQAQTSAAATALAAKQSTPTSVDLHGVSVKDAVRIARERVDGWWSAGAAEWAREGKGQGSGGYRIIVGLGRHSEGGKGRLGPAVGGMLVREGWRVEVGQGELVVWGRARK
ncbi:hypothetical protein MMC30_002489 [Trapelia coarctata]|nr:hypothetical protein [Trapelia coarctata]